MYKIIIFFFLSVFVIADDKYICKTDDAYLQYISGNASNLDGGIFYDNLSTCETNCRDYKTCDIKDVSDVYFVISGKNTLSLNDAVAFEGTIHGKNISEIEIVSNSILFYYQFNTPISGDVFNFPDSYPNGFNNRIIYNTAYENNGDYIKTFKKFGFTTYLAKCNANDVLENGQCYTETNQTFDINASNPCVEPNLISGSICIERIQYDPTCDLGDFEKDGECIHFNKDNPTFGLEVKKDGITHTMQEGTYQDPNTGETLNNSFYMNFKTIGEGYTCNPLKGQIKAGDINDNLFSSKNDCEGYCFLQNGCASVSDSNTSCIVTDQTFSNPVTDWTGKTVYTKSSQTLKCESKETQQTGCEEYKITNNFGSVSYDLSKVGWRYSTYQGMEEATTNALMTEQMQHIFSGWSGYCESGMMFSNPFNDPMKILSYAMMVYSAAGQEKLGSSMKTAHDKIQSGFDTTADKISSSFSSGSSTAASATSGYSSAVVEGAAKASQSLAEKLAEYNTIWTKTLGENFTLTLKWTAIAEAAMSIAFPPEEEFIQADNLLKSYMGGTAQDSASLAYASCMASIGLSFPNLVSWSANDENGMSMQLKAPYENPIRLTDRQVAILINATSEKFVKASLMPIEVISDNMMTYIALTSDTYFQVGQVICADKLAIAQNIINSQTTPAPSGGDGQNYGMVAAKMAISMLPPPYNLVASLILDIITSFESGNACSDQELAMKWGMIQFKTNQHLNFNQCHQTGSECVAKYFWGSCMRTRNTYCCYDQISTRIMMEGLKVQLGKGWDNCSDISINELKDISFTPCKPGEDPYIDHCFPSNKYDEFVDMMQIQATKGLDTLGMEEIIKQGINSMAIPGRDLKEMCEGCDL